MSINEIWVDKSNFRNTRTVEASQPQLGEGEIRVAIDKFALTSIRYIKNKGKIADYV